MLCAGELCSHCNLFATFVTCRILGYFIILGIIYVKVCTYILAYMLHVFMHVCVPSCLTRRQGTKSLVLIASCDPFKQKCDLISSVLWNSRPRCFLRSYPKSWNLFQRAWGQSHNSACGTYLSGLSCQLTLLQCVCFNIFLSTGMSAKLSKHWWAKTNNQSFHFVLFLA